MYTLWFSYCCPFQPMFCIVIWCYIHKARDRHIRFLLLSGLTEVGFWQILHQYQEDDLLIFDNPVISQKAKIMSSSSWFIFWCSWKLISSTKFLPWNFLYPYHKMSFPLCRIESPQILSKQRPFLLTHGIYLHCIGTTFDRNNLPYHVIYPLVAIKVL